MNDDEVTSPDARSPFEFILCELNDIKALCTATNRWQAITMMASFCALVLAACAYTR